MRDLQTEHRAKDTITFRLGAMTGVQRVALDASTRAGAASGVAMQQTPPPDGLSATSRQLVALSDRLRHSISRFSVTASDEARVPPADAVQPSLAVPSTAAVYAAQ